jgi:hypothetical protein
MICPASCREDERALNDHSEIRDNQTHGLINAQMMGKVFGLTQTQNAHATSIAGVNQVFCCENNGTPQHRL